MRTWTGFGVRAYLMLFASNVICQELIVILFNWTELVVDGVTYPGLWPVAFLIYEGKVFFPK